MDYRVEDRPALTDVVVTSAMIEAGLEELREHSYREEWGQVLEDIYRAMSYASLAAPSIKSLR